MAESDSESGDTKRARAGRSPAYPSIALRKALEQAQALYSAESKYAAPLPSAFKAWGYSGKSSAGRQTLATLRYFGLIEIEGEGDDRKAKVSDLALRVLLDKREDQTERKKLLRQAAINPAINQQIAAHYPTGLASDSSVVHYLVFDCGYNEGAAAEVLQQFKETSEFAELYSSATVSDKVEADTEQLDKMEHEGTAGREAPSIGDPFGMSRRAAIASEPDLADGWAQERLIDEDGEIILIHYKGKPSQERYEYIRDYLNFKVQRMSGEKKK